MQAVQAAEAAQRDQAVSELRAEIQQVRAEEDRLASILGGVAESADDQLGRRREGG
jgi:hypothetical protein